MFYIYKYKKKEYIVKILSFIDPKILKMESPTHIEFLYRVDGGRGRKPNKKIVPYKELVALKDLNSLLKEHKDGKNTV